ncbi:MAG: hypothetical protein EA376_10520 [Phycisphaeraceae bacterium]|nr:MAG: hypothetical protein EA376_10520 [Phycisphaeraceae bacterium]
MIAQPGRTRRGLWSSGVLFILAGLLLTGAAGTVRAQTDGDTEVGDPAETAPLSPEVTIIADPEAEAAHVRRATGLRLARLALLYLRQLGDPMPADYRIVAMVMNEASELAPDDAEIVRRAVEAWHAAGDDAEVLRATERLVTLDPDDTVSQLRLIAANIRMRHQDADSRQAVYDRLLGSAGSRLDPSIRSRLALDDAMLSRELGDDDRFLRRLTQAVQLDSTNKEAASLAATYYMARQRDPLGRVEVLTNLVLADPHDRSAYTALKHEFMRHGAYWGAMRMSRRVASLAMIHEDDLSREHIADELVIRWGLEGPRRLLDHLQQEADATKHELDRLRMAYIKAELDPEEIPPYTPDPVQQRIRLIAAISISEGEISSEALPYVVRSSEDLIRRYVEHAESNPAASQQALRASRNVQSELVWLHLWSGVNNQRARMVFEDIRNHIPDLDRTIYEAFFNIEEGKLDEAEAELRVLADQDVRARIGLGLIAEIRGEPREAVRHYARIVLDQPGSLPQPEIPYGLWASTRIQFLLDEPLRASETAQRLDEYASRLPRAIEAVTSSPHNFMHLAIEQVEPSAPPLDPMMLRVRLRNISDIPLPLGPQSALNTSLLLIPRVLIEGRRMTDQVESEVASINRRLRLRPGETLETIVWAGQGQTGALLDQIVAFTSNVRWRAMQSFRINSETRIYERGPLSLSAETDRQLRPRIHHANDRPEEVIQMIEVASGRILLEAIMRARYVLFSAESLARAPGDVEKYRAAIADAVVARYQTMSPAERAFTLLALPAAFIFEQCEVIDDVARRDDERIVRAAFLLSRIASRDDEIFTLIDDGDDPFMHELSDLIRRRIGGGVRPASPQIREEDLPDTPARP